MTQGIDRRQLLRTSVAAATVAGLGGAGLLAGPASPAAAAGTAKPGVGHLPPVPGMLGDRYSNEFWYEFDNVTLFEQSAEVTAAFVAIEQYLATVPPPPRSLVQIWQEMRQSPDYPRNLYEFTKPIKEPLRALSHAEAGVFDKYFRPGDPRLVKAFVLFGQGVLFDPRHTPPVHTMGSLPPVGYHVWHIFIRSMILHGIEPLRWRLIAPLNGLAWEIQSICKPSQEHVNPGLPARQIRRLERAWLPRNLEQLDRQFESFPYPPGVS
ncbi:hypothetical protein AB0J83_47845 [Actinoplanes sp. NPDC049596]|uniref:hypothetical protein n=1 Tax=unclassified Actinoplanes TaxID=2626549 RepID=UPI003417D00C